MELIDKILSDRNLTEACTEVIRNKGACGVDGMTIKELKKHLDNHRQELKDLIYNCNYIPQPIRGKEIPKGNGKMRLLGIPTALDRMLQQSVSRVIMAEQRPVAYLVDIVPSCYLNYEDVGDNFNGSVLDFFIERGDPLLGSSRCEIAAIAASPEVSRALNIQRGDSLMKFEALLYDNDGNPVDYSFSYFLPGYFKFHVVRSVG